MVADVIQVMEKLSEVLFRANLLIIFERGLDIGDASDSMNSGKALVECLAEDKDAFVLKKSSPA